MEYKTALSKLQLLSGRLYFLLLVSLGLLVSNLILVGLLSWSLANKTRTIVPIALTAPVSVSNYAVDSSYLRQMALFFVFDRLNLTPNNVQRAQTVALQYTDPKFYHVFSTILAKEKKEIVAQNISSVFYLSKIVVHPNKLEVVVDGKLQRWIGSLGLDAVSKRYLLKFTYSSGVLRILSFSEIARNNNA